MKVFVTSDIHGRFNVLHKIIMFLKERNDIECIILCGDISADHEFYCFTELEDKQYDDYKRIKHMLNQVNIESIFILGNHDVFNVEKGDNDYLPYCDKKILNNFVAIEYTNFTMYGLKREGNEEDMAFRLSKLKIDNKSIIVSHMPPYKCLDKDKNGIYRGSSAIREMIKEKKPAYFFCGHVHDAFGFKKLYNTLVFNAACNENTVRGWVVELETGKYERIILAEL